MFGSFGYRMRPLMERMLHLAVLFSLITRFRSFSTFSSNNRMYISSEDTCQYLMIIDTYVLCSHLYNIMLFIHALDAGSNVQRELVS